MNPEQQDPWNNLVEAWRSDRSANASEPPDESAPLGFSTRIAAHWKAEMQAGAAPSWFDLWERCAVPGACAAMLGLVALAALDGVSDDASEPVSTGLFVIPDLDMPAK